MRRLRVGEWTAVVGAAALLVTLFLPWFGVDVHVRTPAGGPSDTIDITLGSDGVSGWDLLGWFVLAIVLAAVALAAWLAIANATNRPVAQVVAASVLTPTIGTLAFVALALRVLVFQPGPNDIVVLRYGAWLGLLTALVLAVGAWLAIKDERTDAPESAYTPPEPRPLPPGA